ncbi:MAG: O-antigen ligase family protein [Scytonematopsis contorta HA4267-MV1]|jgi:hypothetical protein|nr:O-antigen ligase family protein [Scytonematopsis contorta HA4267-MV1]
MKKDFLIYYQCFLAVVSVAIFYTSMDNYLFDSGITPPPYVLNLCLAIASAPLWPSFFANNIKYIPSSVFKWCALYLFTSVIYFLLSYKNSLIEQENDNRLFCLIFFVTMLIIFSGDKIVYKITIWALLVATAWNIWSYALETLHPEIWITDTTVNPTGRAAGLYLDPGKAASVLLYAMIFCINVLPKKHRLSFVLVIFLGMMPTFSRGGTVCIIGLVSLFFLKGVIPRSQFIYCLLGALFLYIIWGGLQDFLISEAVNLGVLNSDMENRIITFTNPTSRHASDDTSRVDIINYAWGRILEQPLFGHGLGYDQIWDGLIRPHNMYLTFMLQHGLLGSLIIPGLVFCVTKDAQNEAKNTALFFSFMMLVWSIFTHTLLDERHAIMMFAFMATLSKRSYLDSVRQKNKNNKNQFYYA